MFCRHHFFFCCLIYYKIVFYYLYLISFDWIWNSLGARCCRLIQIGEGRKTREGGRRGGKIRWEEGAASSDNFRSFCLSLFPFFAFPFTSLLFLFFFCIFLLAFRFGALFIVGSTIIGFRHFGRSPSGLDPKRKQRRIVARKCTSWEKYPVN